MIYERFEDKKFRGDRALIVEQAEEIILDYHSQGYILSLRQLYYQFVAADKIENSQRSYKRLGKLVTDARLAGLLPWDGIEDRERNPTIWTIEEDVREALEDVEYNFAVDLWETQDAYVEVWVEKAALASVVERACRPRRVPFLPCKGYLSASEAWRAGKRFGRHWDRECHVIHLGDHDPSGIDMTRDNIRRLRQLSENPNVHIHRIALNRDQIDEFDPPPNPAKMTDSRATKYIAEHGTSSWELDALEPSVTVDLIQRKIESLIEDDYAWDEALEREHEERKLMAKVRDRWRKLKPMIEKL